MKDSKDTPLYVHLVRNGRQDILDHYFKEAKVLFEALDTDRELSEKITLRYLHFAVMCRQKDEVEKILNQKRDPNVLCELDKIKRTPLMIAAETGQTEVVKLLIKNGADIKLKDEEGNLAIHLALKNNCPVDMIDHFSAQINIPDSDKVAPLNYAIFFGNLDQVERLLILGADINYTYNNCTALSIALACGHAEMAELLIESGSKLSLDKGNTHHNDMLKAAENGHLACVKLLLQHMDVAAISDNNKNTLLHEAAANGRLAIIKDLLEHKAELNLKNLYGATPLHLAIKHKNYDCARLLTESGADINAIASRNYSYGSLAYLKCNDHNMHRLYSVIAVECKTDQELKEPIHERYYQRFSPTVSAILTGNVAHAKEVLGKGDAKGIVTLFESCLDLAVENEDCPMIDLLIKTNTAQESQEKMTLNALCCALEFNKLIVVQHLLKKIKDLNIHHEYRGYAVTPLCIAATSASAEIIDLLIKQGANVNFSDNLGDSPLIYAVAMSHSENVKTLIKLGSDINHCGLIANQKSYTALNVAVIKRLNGIIEELLSHKPQINFAETKTQNPLFLLEKDEYYFENLTVLLINAGANVNETQDGITLLMSAILHNHSKFAEFILRRNIDIHMKSVDTGENALMMAIKKYNLVIAKKLIENEAKINDVNLEGKSSLDLIVQLGRVEMLKILLERGLISNGEEIFATAHSPEMKRTILEWQLGKFIEKIKKTPQAEVKLDESKAERFATAIKPVGDFFHRLTPSYRTHIKFAEKLLHMISNAAEPQEFLALNALLPERSELLHICQKGLMIATLLKQQSLEPSLSVPRP